MNHRSVRNGAPLAGHIPNIATEARRAGYEPLLFGYTDTSIDPTGRDANDPDLKSYEGLLPGFAEALQFRFDTPYSWLADLKTKGYDLPADFWELQRADASGGGAQAAIAENFEHLGKWVEAMDAYSNYLNNFPEGPLVARAKEQISWIKTYRL